MQDIRLIGLDLDGTVFDDAKHISPRNLAAIEAAVQKANAGLPDYARIGRWVRLDTPFSPANGLLTANGRPKRDAILARYREHFSEPVNA